MSGQLGVPGVGSTIPEVQSLDTSAPAVRSAREELTQFVLARAAEASHSLGFPRVGVPDAPRTYDELEYAFERSCGTKMALPVSTKGMKGSLYLHAQATLALRFWQSVSHVQHRRSFSTIDRLELGLWQVALGRVMGLSPLALGLLEADLVSAVLLSAVTGKRPVRPRDFALDVVAFGVADAIVLETERRTGK